ncbi:MAG: stimulus-sensing domain-containing protein [Alphaproteobacteria bacterium]|nr:stimulus-sensing domain-containing protein [Alphaproteobacteria bacterium]
MESVTVTATTPPRPAAEDEARPARRGRRFRTLFSPLTRRLLAVNLLAPVVLVVGVFFLDDYRDELIAAETAALRIHGEMMAAALGEGAVVEGEDPADPILSEDEARPMLRRLAEQANLRARLFDREGRLLADSLRLGDGMGAIQIESLPPPERPGFRKRLRAYYDRAVNWLPERDHPPLIEPANPSAADWAEATAALDGGWGAAVRSNPGHGLTFSVAVPVQRYKQVVGAVMVSTGDHAVAASLFAVRLAVLQVFLLALAVTISLTIYLAGTITRPVRRLAAAADQVRRGHGRHHHIPDLSRRGDEIGELSAALRDMTAALWRRMDAIESFAADVSHELKNPLTSLRSAVETIARVKDQHQQARLLAIIQEDVGRLDRLISDISDASRLDAELSRAETGPVRLGPLIEGLVEVYRSTGVAGGLSITLDLPPGDPLEVPGLEGRLVQVFRNLLANAISFSPPDGTIHVAARRGPDDTVTVAIEDDGPGIPDNKLEAIFERFYSERPRGEKFGTHSGLGLSISKQIVDAHGGAIRAENRPGPDGEPAGARFLVVLHCRA